MTQMYEFINKHLKEYYKLLSVSFLLSAIISILFLKRIGIKNSAMLFVALFFLIIDIYLIFKDKRKSILLFILLLPIFTTVRRICYYDFFFMKITFETIYITLLFIFSFKDIVYVFTTCYNWKDKFTFKFIFLITAFLIFCINSSFFSSDIMRSIREVYIGVLTPIMLMLTLIAYFNKEDKYKIYYAAIAALNFSCLYGYVQLLAKGASLGAIKANRIYLTFGFHNVNIFAGILITVSPLLLEMILHKKNTKNEKIFLYLSFINYSLATLLTFTRGAWLTYFVVIFLALLNKKYRKIIYIAAVPSLFVAKPVLSYILHRGTSTSFLNNSSAVARLQSIFTDIIMMKNYPFGIGGGSFPEAYKKFAFQGYLSMPESIRFNSTAAPYPLDHAHNLLLQIGVEFGLVAAFIFIFIIINRLKASFKDIDYNRGAINAIIVYCIFSLITGNEFNHKGVITGTLIIFIIFGIVQLTFKNNCDKTIRRVKNEG
ncbi:O-antigen ligase family protein [Clostridium sp. MSJ-11]|uniref:O-antigen ligase family protein n=1 Tax=Clostridium mobile TaxID=2841512 RepID=A0ABS6EJV3_9CLOT|nr:O-antigen ligase family protein [Clostridium mobile]